MFCFDGGPLEQVETLVNASPATVSRAGIIFVSDTDLDWSPVVEGWILKRPSAEQAIFKDLFARFEYPRYRPCTYNTSLSLAYMIWRGGGLYALSYCFVFLYKWYYMQ